MDSFGHKRTNPWWKQVFQTVVIWWFLSKARIMDNKGAYRTFEEWHGDLERMRKFPNDTHLFHHVMKRIDSSEEPLKKEIKDYLSNSMLETNPIMIMTEIAKANPEYRVIIRSKEDPWFHV